MSFCARICTRLVASGQAGLLSNVCYFRFDKERLKSHIMALASLQTASMDILVSSGCMWPTLSWILRGNPKLQKQSPTHKPANIPHILVSPT